MYFSLLCRLVRRELTSVLLRNQVDRVVEVRLLMLGLGGLFFEHCHIVDGVGRLLDDAVPLPRYCAILLLRWLVHGLLEVYGRCSAVASDNLMVRFHSRGVHTVVLRLSLVLHSFRGGRPAWCARL